MNNQQLRNWFHEQMIEPEDNYSDKNGDSNYLCPAGRVQRGLPAFKQETVAKAPASLEVAGMLWTPCKENVWTKAEAFECRQPWLDALSRYCIVHEDSAFIGWSATWWYGNVGKTLGNSDRFLDMAELCKSHLERMAAGAMKASQ